MSTQLNIYYVTVIKHGGPQCLVAGPYLDWDSAIMEADRQHLESRNAFEVVTQEITVSGVE